MLVNRTTCRHLSVDGFPIMFRTVSQRPRFFTYYFRSPTFLSFLFNIGCSLFFSFIDLSPMPKSSSRTPLDKSNFVIVGMFLQSNTTGVTSGTGTAYPSGAPEFLVGFVLLDL